MKPFTFFLHSFQLSYIPGTLYDYIDLEGKPLNEQERKDKRKNDFLRNDFKMLIQTLWEGKENKEKLIEFFDNNDEVDMVRDENLIATIPQLNEVYEWTQR